MVNICQVDITKNHGLKYRLVLDEKSNWQINLTSGISSEVTKY